MRLASILLLAMAASVAAQARPKIAILDIHKAILATEDGKTAAADLQRRFAPEQEKLSGEQREIDELQKQWNGQATRPDEESRAFRLRIDDLTRTHGRHVEDARREFDEERKRILAELGAKIIAVVAQLAKQEHFELVLDDNTPESPVLWRAAKTEITDQVIQRYNLAQRKK